MIEANVKYPFAHEQSVLEVGKRYTVAHAKLQGYWMQRKEYSLIPIIPNAHTDTQFDINYEHFHIDGRFFIAERDRSRLDIIAGLTNTILPVSDSDFKETAFSVSSELIYKVRKCLQLETGLDVIIPQRDLPPLPPCDIVNPNSTAGYWKWYSQWVGRSCKGKRCPHLGTVMMEGNGILKCPLHNLIGSVETEKIIEVA